MILKLLYCVIRIILIPFIISYYVIKNNIHCFRDLFLQLSFVSYIYNELVSFTIFLCMDIKKNRLENNWIFLSNFVKLLSFDLKTDVRILRIHSYIGLMSMLCILITLIISNHCCETCFIISICCLLIQFGLLINNGFIYLEQIVNQSNDRRDIDIENLQEEEQSNPALTARVSPLITENTYVVEKDNKIS